MTGGGTGVVSLATSSMSSPTGASPTGLACPTDRSGSGSALLSCLGFPGWGALHLIVPSRGDPGGLAGRLPAAGPENGGDEEIPAGEWLPALLRKQSDLLPLDPRLWPWAGQQAGAPSRRWAAGWGHRYLLVCRWGSSRPLRLSAWRQRAGEWQRLCGDLPPSSFRRRFLGVSPDASSAGRWTREGLRR